MSQISGLTLFFLLSFFITKGQIVDNFEGERLDTTIWKGDVDKFQIESGQLRLRGSENDSRATLNAAFDGMLSEQEWRFSIELDFNPSGQNYLEIWLLSMLDQLENSEGILLRIGATGSDDRVEVIKRENNVETILASGGIGKVAESPIANFVITRANFTQWKALVSYEDFLSDLLEFENMLVSDEGYFVIDCHFTSTRRDKFFFDNIYVGPPIIDTTSPSLTNVMTSTDEILLTFSESINNENLAADNFQFEPEYELVGIEYPDLNSIRLLGGESFSSGTSYVLSLINIPDNAGNTLDTLIYFDFPIYPEEGDILLNEILFNPRGSGADYIELVNVSENTLNLDNIILLNTDNSQTEELLFPIEIKPGEIIAITDDRSDVIEKYPSSVPDRIFEQDIPSFNNDDGNISIILQNGIEDILLDAFDYSEDYHLSILDDEDGVSLERISLQNSTQDPQNWTSSSSLIGFGTPGRENSVSSIDSTLELIAYEVVKKVFSPFQNGPESYAEISIQMAKPSFLATARIYDLNGQEVRTLWRNQILGTDATIKWDGKDSNGTILPIGIYILILEFFNLEGATTQIKVDLVLADFLDK